MEESIAISVIVPVYNSGKYLRQGMCGIMTQTAENIEIICVNDASTDNSLSILQELQKNDSRIKIILHEVNKGAGVSRNH